MTRLAVVILAAGKGTRMRSHLPKVLHPLGGKPLVVHAIELASRLSPDLPVLIVGHGSAAVRRTVGATAICVEQAEQLGTGHAVMHAEATLTNTADLVLVYYADMPLLTIETLRDLVSAHTQHNGPITLLTFTAEDPRGFGRIVRGAEGSVAAIVEEAEATPEQKVIRELNAGVYCFDARWLWSALHRLQPSAQKGEYYLTDVVALAQIDELRVQAVMTHDPSELIGINTRVHLAEAEAILRRRINTAWMNAGVTFIDPEHTYVGPDVIMESDVVLGPGVSLRGATFIGARCQIAQGALLTDVRLDADCRVGPYAVLDGIELPAGASYP